MTFPNGVISQHSERIYEEMKATPPQSLPLNHTISTPQTTPSAEDIFGHEITDFVNSTNIVETIRQASTFKQRNHNRKNKLAFIDPKRSLRGVLVKFKNLMFPNEALMSPGESTYPAMADIQLQLIKNYIGQFGAVAPQGEKADLALACCQVLEGKGGEEFKHMTLKTMQWQRLQMQKVQSLLDFLYTRQYLFKFYGQSAIERLQSLDDESRRKLLKIHDRFMSVKCIRDLMQPVEPKIIRIFYQDAFNLLINNIVVNQLFHPDCAPLETVVQTAEQFLEQDATIDHPALYIPSALFVDPTFFTKSERFSALHQFRDAAKRDLKAVLALRGHK